MRLFSYYDWDGLKFITYDEIMTEYYPYWKKKMEEALDNPRTNAYKRPELINKQQCLNDWLAVNWGQEVKKGEKLERNLF